MQHAVHIKPNGRVLDLACGAGRNAIWLANQGFQVLAVDRDAEALANIPSHPNIRRQQLDLEQADWPLCSPTFDGIVVCRYLYRPHIANLLNHLNEHGVLIYETFMLGNEAYGRPSNPDFLLNSNELLRICMPTLKVMAYEEGLLQQDPPAVLQRICAVSRSG